MGHDRTPREFPGYTDSILTGDTKLKGSSMPSQHVLHVEGKKRKK
jgi:hypothetical protein